MAEDACAFCGVLTIAMPKWKGTCSNLDVAAGCRNYQSLQEQMRHQERTTSALRVYFAHPMVDYHTPREQEAVAALQMHFGPEFAIVNPNVPEHQKGYVDSGRDFGYWTNLARSCMQVAYMSMPGGRWIGSGVWKEVDAKLGQDNGLVWEISRERPYSIERVLRLDPERLLTVEETRRWTRIMEAYRDGR